MNIVVIPVAWVSANRGFFGSRPFSKINNNLIKRGKTPIKW